MSATGVLNVPLKYEAVPLEFPTRVADARSEPVGRPPLVARIESVRLGAVPLQPLQTRLTSALTQLPLVDGVKVCPNQVVVVTAIVVLSEVFA